MTTNIPSSPPTSFARQPQGLPYPNRDLLRSPDPDGGVLQDLRDNSRVTSVTIPIPKQIDILISTISSILDKLDPMERHYLGRIITVVCVETVFLMSIGQPTKDVLSAILFTVLFGFALPVWSNLKHVQRQLDVLQGSIKSLESTLAVHPPVGSNDPTLWTRDDPTSKSPVHPVLKPVDSELEGPDEPSVTNDKSHYSPYKLPDILEPVMPSVIAMDRPSPVPPTLPGSYHGGVTVEGMDNIVGVSDFGTGPVKTPFVTKNLLSPAPIAPPRPDHGVGITLEGMDNIVGVSDSTAGGSAERIAVMPEPASSHWLPALREIKQHIEQFTEGRIEKTYRFDQDESSNRVQLRRCGVRLLMSSASLSPADFASPVGFLGPSESTPYYPTGDLQRDRTIAFTTAMDCLLDLMEFHPHGNDDVKVATTFFELAQALSDLGLHKYALDTSGFALDTLERPFVAIPNDVRHHVASILSLQANILCDLKQNDEAVEKADRSVTLFREHRDSQTTPVPEFAFALLNYSILLSSVGLKDESAAVAFEIREVDGSQLDMKDVSALCNLCLSNMRFDAEDGMDLSTTEETIELTRTSSDSIPQMALAGALLNKSKILSSRGQNEAAIPFSAEAVTLLRGMSATRAVFSLFLAHALDTHAHHLSELNRKGESYSIRRDAVERWQALKVSAPGPIARPLAWSLFELAKFRHQGGEKDVLREELRVAEGAVEAFRGVEPPDVPGLADALYLFANRMLELDKNREAATYAEESVHHFREASAEDQKYALDLIFSLSLASSCLAYTERDEDALEYAKQAVAVQHGRKGVEDKQFDAHLRRLLMDVVIRSMEMNKEREALPWLQELQALDPSVEKSMLRRSGMPQDNEEEFKKQTSHWMDPKTDTPRPHNTPTSSVPVARSSTLRIDKGKGKENIPARGPTTQDAKGKAKEINPLFSLSAPGRSLPDEEIFSPGAAAQRKLASLGTMGPRQGDIIGGGAGGNSHLGSLLGMGSGRDMGGRTLGGLGIGGGMGNLGSSGRLGGGRTLGDMGSLGGGINGLTEGLLGSLNPDFFKQGDGYGAGSNTSNGKTDGMNGGTGAQGGANSQSSSASRTGTWSGMGIQSRLSDEDA